MTLSWIAVALKYECPLETMAGLMISDPTLREGPRDGKTFVFRTTFTKCCSGFCYKNMREGSETETAIMDLAARAMKDAVGKKGSTSEFGWNYGKKDG